MKSRTIYSLFLILLLAQLFFIPKTAVAVQAVVVSDSTLCSAFSTTINPCYTSVQSAITDAMAGVNGIDSIKIFPGTYTVATTPQSTLNKGITIFGTQTGKTFLDGGGGSSILTVSVPTAVVNISNLTFLNASTGITVLNATTSVNINNNIFALGTASTAIKTSISAPTNIKNNVFYNVFQAIQADTTSLSSIANNIFSQSGTATAISAVVSPVSISNNLFNVGTVGPAVEFNTSATDYKGNLQNQDPLYVNAGSDFHLRAGSPCHNTGTDNNAVTRPSVTAPDHDMGAYGGPGMDTVPFPVSSLTFTTPTTTSAKLSWPANLDYLVQGYRVYYGYALGKRDGTDAVVSGVPAPSPIDAGNVTSLLVDGLTRVATAPTGTPIITSIAPQNGSLIVSWTTVSGASSYNIYYKEESSSGAFNKVNTLTSATSFTLSGLKNSVWYDVYVTAVAQATYYFSVTAYYQISTSTIPGVAYESTYSSPEQPINVGTPQEGLPSTTARGAPDQLVPLPNLKNSGCFIATAAYNSADAPAVRILRNFRDRILAASTPGREFIAWYYRTSPALAEKLNAHPALKPLVRVALEPVVAAAFVLTEAPSLLLVLLLFFLAAVAFKHLRGRRTATILRS